MRILLLLRWLAVCSSLRSDLKRRESRPIISTSARVDLVNYIVLHPVCIKSADILHHLHPTSRRQARATSLCYNGQPLRLLLRDQPLSTSISAQARHRCVK